MFKKFFVIALAILFVVPVAVQAGCGSCGSGSADHKHDHDKGLQGTMGHEASFEGSLVCVKCSLKQESGARSACKIDGCLFAVKTADGKYINLFENKYSKDLLKGGDYHNKPVKVTGTYFANANLLDVTSFTVDGKTKSWCDHCSSMDGCMAKK